MTLSALKDKTEAPVQSAPPLRPPSDFQRNNFNLLRLLAAGQVLLFHSMHILHINAPTWLAPLKAFPGVPIFFVISGFLVSASYERSSSLSSYFRNRFLRIYPGLWAVVILTVVVASLFGFSFLHPGAVTWEIAQLAGLIYTPGFLRSFGYGSYNASLWTIPLELQFYIVLPLLYWLAGRWSSTTRALLVLFAAFSAIAWLTAWFLPNLGLPAETGLEKLYRYTFVPHVFLFLAGVLLQRLGAHDSGLFRGKLVHWTVAYVVFDLAMPSSPHVYVPTLLFLGGWAISFAYSWPGLSDRLLGDIDISYGTYIYHGLVLNVLVALGWLVQPVLVPVVFVATVVFGYLSWTLVERPCLRRKSYTLRSV
ncbi:MAG: acyltransferase family protein [Hyphomicrobiaceae bacterium]